MSDQIAGGTSAVYRAASEALHREPVAEGQAARFRKLWECGFADLIRTDFYALLDLPRDARGNLLEAGCGTGIDTANLRRLASGLGVHGVDISSLALADAAARCGTGGTLFYQAALERLPFADAVFDYISSHEVIEHIEDPAVALHELFRVLKPGGVAAIATPNGASWWLEHLRQRMRRVLGRRGAAVGEDHTRPPSFWRREFRRAGFVVERRIFDGAALEFQMLIAPASWMPVLSRLFEPLHIVPGINLVLCDRVKFRLSKPGHTPVASGPVTTTCCPICHTGLSEGAAAVVCGQGHRFARNRVGMIDFTALASEIAPNASAATGVLSAATRQVHRSTWSRRWRRVALLVLSVGYAGYLLLLAPLGLSVAMFYQPFRRQPLP
jgi:ubiquinone/menaquinone biosynthesis C-methylase UbiE